MYQPTTLIEDEQKLKLMEKRSAHISTPSNSIVEFMPNQLIWFSEDGCPEWKPGTIESKDINHPDSYWIINAYNDRQLRRNKNDLKNAHWSLVPHHQHIQPIHGLMLNHLMITVCAIVILQTIVFNHQVSRVMLYSHLLNLQMYPLIFPWKICHPK